MREPWRSPFETMYPSVDIVRVPPDNYCYFLRARTGREVAVIDPGEAGPVEFALAKLGLHPQEIWLTHKHPDHIGGAGELARRHDIPVRGPVEIPQLASRFLLVPGVSDRFMFGGYDVRVGEVAGHTLHHVVYVLEGAVFTGDVLFLGGVGRIFEGTAAQLFEGIERHLAPLPDNTRIYCGHEYTERNLRFASQLEPSNQAVLMQFANVRARLAEGEPTVPGEMGIERRTNPFLRVRDPRLQEALTGRIGTLPRDPAGIFTALRSLRDSFRA